MTQPDGFTLIEILVVIALIAALTAAAVTQLPRIHDSPTTAKLPDRLATELEAAHTQAYSERRTVTLTGQGSRLLLTTSDGTEPEVFDPATLSGTIQIDASGNTSGQLNLQAPSIACTTFTLSSAGTATRSPC